MDLPAQHAEVADEVHEGWARVVAGTSFILGDEVRYFEDEFASYSGVRHCVAVGNGTDALELSLRALGVGTGDEVLVPTNSFIASALAVARTGATPVLVDSDPETHLIDVDAAATRLTGRCKAIMPVHLFGQVAPMGLIEALVGEAGPVIVEDAAQAQGARQGGVTAGGFGTAAATSFYPAKNLGAYGDAGAVLTNSDGIARRVANLRNYGSREKYEHAETGFNSRLDSLQAVVLRAKLRRLERWNEQRRCAAARYDNLLTDMHEVVTPTVLRGNQHVWHLYVIRVPRRDDVLCRLKRAGIEVGIHYPRPIHLQGAFRHLGHREGDFPVAEAAAQQILSLPMFPHITAGQQERVVDELCKALR